MMIEEAVVVTVTVIVVEDMIEIKEKTEGKIAIERRAKKKKKKR